MTHTWAKIFHQRVGQVAQLRFFALALAVQSSIGIGGQAQIRNREVPLAGHPSDQGDSPVNSYWEQSRFSPGDQLQA